MTTIHITGQSAKTAPLSTELSASPTGIFQTDDRDDQADDQAGQGRLPRRPAQHAEQHQYHDDRQDGDEKRKPEAVSDGRQKLLKHDTSSLGSS